MEKNTGSALDQRNKEKKTPVILIGNIPAVETTKLLQAQEIATHQGIEALGGINMETLDELFDKRVDGTYTITAREAFPEAVAIEAHKHKKSKRRGRRGDIRSASDTYK